MPTADSSSRIICPKRHRHWLNHYRAKGCTPHKAVMLADKRVRRDPQGWVTPKRGHA
jgi:hypothetical protein